MTESSIFSRHWSITAVARMLISSNALASIKPQDAILLAQRMRLCQVNSGAVMFKAGDTNTDFMALVLDGEAVVQSTNPGVGEAVVFSVVTAGQMIGEMGVIANTPRSANVTASSDMVVAILDQSAFARLIQQAPQVACGFLSSLLQATTDRLRESNRKLQTLTAINKSLFEELEESKQNESELAELFVSTSAFADQLR
jgi:CRP/FNR family transcriptional regulator, cyclic AMP receptor protein